jgi:hypothetical protein
MTKSRDNKQAIRAYMRAHGVNYTTAKRALREQATRTGFTADQIAASSRIEQDSDLVFVPFTDGQQPATDLTVDLTSGPGIVPDEWHLDKTTTGDPDEGRDEDGYALTVRRAPVYLDPHLHRDDLTRFPHVHDLNGTCLTNRHRELCDVPAGTTPARPTVAAITAAFARDHTANGSEVPVFMDTIKATMADQTRAHHIHDLTGRCVKNRTGNFCDTPPGNARVAIGVDPDHEYVHTVIHTLNGPTLTDGLSTDEPGIDLGADFNASPEAAARAITGEPIPDGATIRRWQETARLPDTGERVPALVTHVLYPADENGHRKETTTRTLLPADPMPTGVLVTDEAWALMPHQQPSRRNNLKKALATGKQDVLNAHLREHAPGPHIDDLHAALEQLASLELELREHTDDPESPVTYEMLRHAILATTTHGTRWGGGKWHPTAADVCRSYLLAVKVTTSEDTPEVDGQYRVQPEDLAGVLEAVADDDATLDEAAHGTAADADDIAEELLILANELCKPATTPGQPSSTGDDTHYLVVTEGARHIDRCYTIDCTTPTKGRGSCEGWEECDQCSFLGADEWDAILDTGTAHGVEHIMLSTGPAIATGQCALQAFPEAWEESDAILNLPPGRYAINSKWEDEYCTIWLRTH